MRILIAEQDTPFRRALESTLIQWGQEVICSSDGTEAFQILQGPSTPELAILDWSLPGMDGLHICGELAKGAVIPPPYLILLADREQGHDPLAGLEAGAHDCLVKPFNAGELQLRLRVGQRSLDVHRELIAARNKLLSTASVDPLTGLWNRRMVVEFLDREVERARRENASLGVVLADLDDFKAVNDSHGHAVGDAILCEVGKRLCRSLRPYDGIGRLGGDDFLIALPGCDFQETVNLAERLRAAIASHPVKMGAKMVAVSVSAGVAAADSSANLRDADSFIRAAETALDKATDQQHNRLAMAASGTFLNSSG
ncbi:MAG: diguanylate cyclase [Nitrospira sp.]|nr:diguanylate cyclase [Nitrospira sp.]